MALVVSVSHAQALILSTECFCLQWSVHCTQPTLPVSFDAHTLVSMAGMQKGPGLGRGVYTRAGGVGRVMPRACLRSRSGMRSSLPRSRPF